MLFMLPALLGLRSAARPTWHSERAAPLCGPGLFHVVGFSDRVFGCVDIASGRLLRVGGTLEAEGSGSNRSFSVDVHGFSSVDGCTEVAGSVRVFASAHQHHIHDLSTDERPTIVSTRNLRCDTDTTWHPDASSRTVTVSDTYFFTAAPTGEGRQLPTLGWNATWSSTETEMWTAPLSSHLSFVNFSASPLVWVGGPSSATDVLAANFTPLAPRRLGDCDGIKCSTAPQPCPGHHNRTFCLSNVSAGQCDAPPVPCPKCPPGSLAGTCKYWYGGALTDLQWRQGIIDNNAQQKELLDAPSLALPVASLLDTATSSGVTFAQSAHDHPVSMTLTTAPASPGGATFRFSRQYHRLGGGNAAVTFSQSLLLHEDCFRPVLRWYDAKFPEVLRVDTNIERSLVDGQGTSVNYHGDANYVPSAAAAANAARSAIAVVRDMSLFEPFHGVWGPYAEILPHNKRDNTDDTADTQWSTCMYAGGSTFNSSNTIPTCWNPNYAQIKKWYQMIPKAFGGGRAFTYTNWFEFGWYSCPTCPSGGWNCSSFSLDDVGAAANTRTVADVNRTLGCYSQYLTRKLNISTNQLVNPVTQAPLVPPGCVGFSSVYDCGAEPYRTHQLNQLKAVLEHVGGEMGGIVIDRWDFVGLTNPRSDDGITAYISPPSLKKAQPMAATTISLLHFMESVSEIIHVKYQRAVTVNDHTYRVDLMKNVDASGDEHGAAPDRMHAGALAFMSKPSQHGRPVQEALYWGSYTGAASTPAAWQEGKAPFGQRVLDYAPLFEQLRGKRWAGEAHAVTVKRGGPAQANLFVIEPSRKERLEREQLHLPPKTMPRVLVIALGPANGSVTVELRGPVEYANASVYHPARSTPLHLSAPATVAATTTLVVPLSSGDPTGCAVVRLSPKDTWTSL